ncbi:IclR family transcriptional regulator [Bradyrhizobium sp. CIAT3101]|uniref:IclR family transcriptional regulator n=1 Tax=Bradyrhizobium sp. CIAT3101 TaxID=439387 RepID=UPI0024B09E8C|nr:IclR family transcriptional regulator [Bradyrhizobium sp. CIAT3101]WFU80549.1 IclR family transcriptional regulator [Bradyrhizobium sp. CIAT3101]
MKTKKISRRQSGPLERYTQVLEVIAGSVNGLTGREIEAVLDLPKTTVNRLVNALESSDLVASSGRGGEFKLGGRLRRILESDTFWIVGASKRRLKVLAEQASETCFVARLSGSSVHFVMMEAPDVSAGVYVTPGHVLPPHATASGKVLTAMQLPRVRQAILNTDLHKLTDSTISDPKGLEREFAKIRKQGYAIENGEHIQGLYTLACPVRSLSESPPIYALGLTGPADRVRSRAIPELLELLKSTASELANAFMPGTHNEGH